MGTFAATWGIVGICFILGNAILRLTAISLESFNYSLDWYHWAIALAWTGFMAFSEGYRGFQKGFSPRVAARIAYLKENPTLLRTLLAPLFCMGYFGITRRRQIITIIITLVIIGVVQLVHLLEQPWRGLIDLGVVVGLIWGLASLLIFTYQALTQDSFPHSPEMPQPIAES